MVVDLKAIIENEWFIVCDLLSTDRFITFCRDRGIEISREQLEQLERLGLFYSVARVEFPRVTVKVEYSEDRKTFRDLGILEEGEVWEGETREDCSSFSFTKRFAGDWMEHGCLWDPRSREFEPWSRFWEDEGRRVESYYSIFQCLPLHHLNHDLTIRVAPEWWAAYSVEQVQKTAYQMANLAKTWIDAMRQNGCPGQSAAVICQAISNRYYPKTQPDRRILTVSRHAPYYDWKWKEYCTSWDADAVRRLLDLSIEQLKRIQEQTALHARWIDPLESWYSLVRFVSIEQRNRLKGDALLAQTLYSMEEMLRLFYYDLTGERLYGPDESMSFRLSHFYGEGVPEDELQFLELLTNRYHLNPRPQLLLLVEGESEYRQIPRIAKELLGYRMEQVGIRIEMLTGIGEAKKVERLIDHYHYRQTIVYLILDNENNARNRRKRLLEARSKYRDVPGRITKPEYVFLWEKCFEFDNFSDEEIVGAMTTVAGARYTFTPTEVAQARVRFGREKDPLSSLYLRKVGYGLNKSNLIEALVQMMLDNPQAEFDAEGRPVRPITGKIWEVIQLAARNYQPVRLKDWRATQQSGSIRGRKEDSSLGEGSKDKS
jgi:hypothetical protein